MRLGCLVNRILLAVTALCLILMTAAAADTSAYTFELNSAGNGYVVTGYSGNDSAITVPDWYNNLPVTEIGSGAFQGNTTIKSVSLPSTIVRIGQAAFKNCTSLNKITTYTASEPPVPERIPGDANGDGRVTAADALLALKYSALWDVEINLANADVTGDGRVTAADALNILKYTANWDIVLQ